MVPSYSDWSRSPANANEKLNEPTPTDLQKDKPKKPRHRHSAFQLAALNELYDKNEHPPLEERTALAERLSMEVKTVNAWFQNKRASTKKRHKSSNPQYELPPISQLIASVSAPAAPPRIEYDELSDDDHLPPISERSLPRIPRSRQRQTAFYAGNPQHRHAVDAEHPSTKKGRSRPSQSQTEELRKLYDRTPHPTREERESLGDRIGMRYQSVTNWFQNQRSIAKKRKEEEDAQSASARSMELDHSSSSSRTFSPFPPSSGMGHPSLSVPPATGHPSLPGLAVPPRAKRSLSAAPASISLDSRPSSPRASPYRVAMTERASSVAHSSRPRRCRPEPYQLDALKKLFYRTSTPSIEERGALALEINMDVGKVTNWFRNLRQTTRKRARKNPDGDDDDDDDVSVATYTAYSRDVSRAGSPFPSASTSVSRAASPRPHDDDGDIHMDESAEQESSQSYDPMEVKVEHDEKNQKVLVRTTYSRSHSDMGSDEEDQEAVTPSPSPPPSGFVPDEAAPKRAQVPARSPTEYTLTYAEMEKATAKFQTGVKVEDALLLLSFHHHVVR